MCVCADRKFKGLEKAKLYNTKWNILTALAFCAAIVSEYCISAWNVPLKQTNIIIII